MASGDTKTEAMLNALGNGGSADEFRGCCNTKTQQYILDAIDRVQNVEDEVEELKNNPDVVDIVDTYADLQAYDTTHLSDNDIIRVLADETHSGNSTYYKFNKQAGTWTFIGEISGGGSTNCRELTSSDYNYPTNNPTTVALWLLDPGVYWWDWNFADGGGISFLSGSGTSPYTNNNLRSYTTQVIVGNSVSGFVTIKCLIRNVNTKDTNFGYSPLFAYSIRVSDGAIVNPSLTSNTIGLGAGDVFADPRTTRKIQIGNSSSTVSSDGISIGYGSSAGGSSAQNCIAIGSGAVVNGNRIGSIALGANSGGNITKSGMVDIGSAFTSYGYEGNSNYRLLTGLYDPQNDHDAATKGYVDANAGGPTVVQAIGSSTTDVMSQNATSTMVYDYVSGSTYLRPKIGNNAAVGGLKSMAIGDDSSAYGQNAVALGGSANAHMHQGAIALGYGSSTSANGEMNIGTSDTNFGYNSSNYRLLSGLYDGQSAHDAATVGQINATIDAINTALSTNIPRIGA